MATHHGGQANFLFLFVLGILSRELAFSCKHRSLMPPVIFSTVIGLFLHPGSSQVISDLVAGVMAALVMAYLGQNPKIAKMLSWRPLTFIGGFSYSIYLIHAYFQMATEIFISKPGAKENFVILMLFTFPATLIGSYAFHLVAERPFMSKREKQAVIDVHSVEVAQ